MIKSCLIIELNKIVGDMGELETTDDYYPIYKRLVELLEKNKK